MSTQHIITKKKIETTSLNYPRLSPDHELSLILSGLLNYPWLGHISMVPKMLEPLVRLYLVDNIEVLRSMNKILLYAGTFSPYLTK